MKEQTPTPHNNARYEQIAKTVIMPGDPKRSKLIATKFLENAQLVNDVRGVQGYTGLYNGKPVTVMASGMGAPSMGIYSHELFAFYDVETIIRVGSAGACQDDINLGDILIGETIVTDSNFDNMYQDAKITTLHADKSLVNKAKEMAQFKNLKPIAGTILATDTFYDSPISFTKARELGYLAMEMEGGALYRNAQKFNKKAIVICTVSDCPLKGLKATTQERQNNFTDMINLALSMID